MWFMQQGLDQQVIAWAQSHGSDANDFRDAVHEAWHGLSLGVENWDREEIHEAIMELRIGDRFKQEIQARAAERLACEYLYLPYDFNHWSGIAFMEAFQSDVNAPVQAWRESIEMACGHEEVMTFVSCILEAS